LNYYTGKQANTLWSVPLYVSIKIPFIYSNVIGQCGYNIHSKFDIENLQVSNGGIYVAGGLRYNYDNLFIEVLYKYNEFSTIKTIPSYRYNSAGYEAKKFMIKNANVNFGFAF
jgi:hypothetical protein